MVKRSPKKLDFLHFENSKNGMNLPTTYENSLVGSPAMLRLGTSASLSIVPLPNGDVELVKSDRYHRFRSIIPFHDKPFHRGKFRDAARSEDIAAKENQHDADVSQNIAIGVGGGLISGGVIAVASTPLILAATIATGAGMAIVVGGLLVARSLRRRQIDHESRRKFYEDLAEDLR